MFPIETIINLLFPTLDMKNDTNYKDAKKLFNKTYESCNPAFSSFRRELKNNIVDFILMKLQESE